MVQSPFFSPSSLVGIAVTGWWHLVKQPSITMIATRKPLVQSLQHSSCAMQFYGTAQGTARPAPVSLLCFEAKYHFASLSRVGRSASSWTRYAAFGRLHHLS